MSVRVDARVWDILEPIAHRSLCRRHGLRRWCNFVGCILLLNPTITSGPCVLEACARMRCFVVVARIVITRGRHLSQQRVNLASSYWLLSAKMGDLNAGE